MLFHVFTHLDLLKEFSTIFLYKMVVLRASLISFSSYVFLVIIIIIFLNTNYL